MFAAAEAKTAGYGGVTAVSQITGVARSTIGRGIKDIESGTEIAEDRIRRPGGGRKALTDQDPTLLDDLKGLVEPNTRGDPEQALLWVSKSLHNLTDALVAMGHQISHTSVSKLLRKLGYSLQANRKTLEGSKHPDRNAQFEHINEQIQQFMDSGQPVISVDTKKKELVGDFKNGGREYRPRGTPEEVQVHDFVNKELGRAAPYGVYDIADNSGWVSVGISSDTASFAVASIRRWWYKLGVKRYPQASRLHITADGGGSNGSRVRLWKVELQKFANETGLTISVSHLPPGTSKWNKIEHRLFSFISQNWRGRPLVSYQVIVQLIGGTTTKTGLTVQCELDENEYATGIKVTDDEIESLNLTKNEFHGEWNYSITPQAPRAEAFIV